MTDTLFNNVDAHDDNDGNVSDWCLQKFQEVYSSDIAKNDIWEYLYGVMHAPDWRAKFQVELQKNLPRIPIAPGGLSAFKAFQKAGRELFELHVNYETGPEADLEVISPEEDFRIHDIMRFRDDKTVLEVNPTCRIVGIPESAHSYQVSGRSPLEWAVDSLRVKRDAKSGIVDDVNGWKSMERRPV